MKIKFGLFLFIYSFLLPIILSASQYSGSTAYQVSGNIISGSKNQEILYIKLDATATPSGTWGISGVRFKMLNTSNALIPVAKLFYNTSASLTGALLLDSISNPTDTLDFNFSLVNLGIISRYLFLSYDIDSSSTCTASIFDASVVASSLKITGLGAGNYTPTNPNPAGNRILANLIVVPSLVISSDSVITCLSDTVSFTALATNGGSNPTFKWYKNGTLRVTNTSGRFSINSLGTGDIIYCKLLSSLPCISASSVNSNNYVVNVQALTQLVTITSNGMFTQGNLIQFTALSNYGGSSPNYQWYKNNLPVGTDKNTFLDSTLGSGDQIYCSVLSNNSCVLPATAISSIYTVTFPNAARSRDVALLDLGPENQETNGSNLYSASHMLDVAGISYRIVTDIFEAQNYKMIVGSSTVGNGVFSKDEQTTLRNYVNTGGILFTVRLKDPGLYSLFGISGFDAKTTRHLMNWNMASNDGALQWFDDSLEHTMSLGDTSTLNVIETLGYTLSSAAMLGSYDDGKVAVSKNAYGSGFAYNFGISLKEIIFRNQVNKDYDAEREYTNAFEPTTDDLFLLLRAIYTTKIDYGVWKHTSPNNSKSALLVTHDIDALSSVNLMEAFANYEDSAKIGSTYFMTAHYNNDIISAFYDSSIADLTLIVGKNRTIASHSVGHFSDMDDSTIIATGVSGNTRASYIPLNNGGATTGASIWGELEVSKNLLQTDCNVAIRSFRPGYLLVHPKQMKVMDSLGFEYSSSYTAADVLTNFPYFIHEDKSFQSRLTSMVEIPLATSDVIRDYVLDSLNYPTLVTKWKNVYLRNHANNAPTVLLIHPTRKYKLSAQRSFVNQLPSGVSFKSLEEFGDFWKNRNRVSFTTFLNGNALTIVVSNASLPLDSSLSFIVNNGQNLSFISVKDEGNNSIAFVQENWGADAKILYLKRQNFIGISEIAINKRNSENDFSLQAVPNPFSMTTEISFTIGFPAFIELEILNNSGQQVAMLIQENSLPGNYKKTFDSSLLLEGLYLCKLSVNGKTKVMKLVLKP